MRLCYHIVVCILAAIGPLAAQMPRLQVQSSHTAVVRAIDVNATASLCLTTSNDYTVRVWSLSTEDHGVLLRVLAGHQGPVLGGIFNQNDSNQCVSWSNDGTVRIWNIEDASSMVISLQDVPVAADVRFKTNLIAVAIERQIQFYDANNGASTDRPVDVPFAIRSLRFSPMGDYLLVGGAEGRVAIYEVRTKRIVLQQTVGERSVVGLLWTDRQRWAAASESGDICSGDINSKVSTFKIQGKLRLMARQSHGQQVTLLDDKGSVITMNVLNGKQRSVTKARGLMSVDAIALLPSGSVLAGVELPRGKHELRMMLLDGSQVVFKSQRDVAIITAVTFVPGTHTILAGDNTGDCWYWNPEQSMRPIQVTSDVLDKVQALLVKPDKKQCVIGGFGREQLGLVDLHTMDVQWLSGLELRGVRSMAYAANGHLFVVDDGDGSLLELTSTNEIRRRWNVNARFVTTDGRNTVVAVGDKEVHVLPADGSDQARTMVLPSAATTVATTLNAETGELHIQKAGGMSMLLSINAKDLADPRTVVKSVPKLDVASVAGVSKGRSMLLAGVDGVLREIRAGEPQGSVVPQSVGRVDGRPQCIDISFDSKFIVTGMHNGTLQIIEAASSTTIATLYANRDGWVVAAPDGRYDGDQSVELSLLVVIGRESRSLSQMPSVFRKANLLQHVFASTDGTRSDAGADVAGTFLSRPASVRFVRKTYAETSIEDVLITFRFHSGGQRVSTISVSEGSRALYAVRSVNRQPLTSRMSTFRCSLRPGLNQFTIKATAENGATSVDTMTLFHKPAETDPPTLHALVVGVGTYEGRYPDLGFAISDASKMRTSIMSASKNASVSMLVDAQATTSAVLDRLREIAKKAKPQDNVILYFAGHGAPCNHQGEVRSQYCLMSYLQRGLPSSQGELGIDSVFAFVSSMNAGGVLVILDACHSGGFAESEQAQQVMNQLSEQGSSIAVIASTAKSAKAAESAAVGGGVFTHLVADGLAGRAKDADGDVTAFSLANFVVKKLPGLCLQYGLPIQRAVVQLGASGSAIRF